MDFFNKTFVQRVNNNIINSKDNNNSRFDDKYVEKTTDSPSASGLATNSGTNEISLSFAGCGFLGLYHVGVASCFREYAPLNPNTIICGASAGALAAMALCLKLPLGESTSEILQVAIKARARALGPFHPSFDVNKIIHDGLVKTLPDDCHKRATGRLYISVTRVSDGKNVLISQFDSKEDLIRAIQCSCFIPFWSGIVPPKFHGIAYMDGGFSDNLPIIDKNTITVSPFSGESDICPQDDTYNLLQVNLVNTSISLSPSNLYRLTRILFPAHPEILSKMCQQGFDDALRFLQRNNKIACTRCLAIQSSFTLGEDEDEETDNDLESSDSGCDNSFAVDDEQHSAINCTNCTDCQYRRQIAVLDSLPDAVVQAIQEACDQVNKGVINWLFRHRPMKLLSILTIPYLLPIDITIVLFCKVWQSVPAIKGELKTSLYNLLNFLRSIVTKMESKRHLYSAKFSCQLAVTEFDYSQEGCPQVYAQNPNSRKVSTIKLPKRKLTTTTTNAVNPTPNARKLVEKAHSFTAGASRKRGIHEPISTSAQELLALKARQRLDRLQQLSGAGHQRKSYAGTHDQHWNASPLDRRRSMIEIIPKVKPPERVISKLNFGFSFDLKNKSNEDMNFGSATGANDVVDGSGDKVLDAFRHLEDMDQSNAIEIANKALDWERECLQNYREFGEREGSGADGTNINKMIELTKKQEALMAFYYTDENNRVKVTEIFNIGAEDESEDTVPNDMTKQFNDEEDGLREEPIVLAQRSPKMPTKSMLSSNTVPSNQRSRKKSVLLVD